MYYGVVTYPRSKLQKIAIDLTVVAARFSRFQRQNSPNDTTAATWRALSLLEQFGALRVTEFARLDRLSQPAATAVLRRIIDDGLAESTSDSADKRAKRVRLTNNGREFLSDLRTDAGDRLIPLFEQLTEEEIEALQVTNKAISRMLRAEAAENEGGRSENGPPTS